jgi:hypothetical protein
VAGARAFAKKMNADMVFTISAIKPAVAQRAPAIKCIT